MGRLLLLSVFFLLLQLVQIEVTSSYQTIISEQEIPEERASEEEEPGEDFCSCLSVISLSRGSDTIRIQAAGCHRSAGRVLFHLLLHGEQLQLRSQVDPKQIPSRQIPKLPAATKTTE